MLFPAGFTTAQNGTQGCSIVRKVRASYLRRSNLPGIKIDIQRPTARVFMQLRDSPALCMFGPEAINVPRGLQKPRQIRLGGFVSFFFFLSTPLNDPSAKYDIQFDSQWGSCRTRAEITQRESTGNPSAIRGFSFSGRKITDSVQFGCSASRVPSLESGELVVGP
jgi:hypothetical protein